MKSKIFLAIAALYAVSCSPKIDEIELKNSFDKDNIQLSYTQDTPGSNQGKRTKNNHADLRKHP